VVDGWRPVSRNVACRTLDAARTVVHVALSVERAMVTGTSGFDHVTRIDRQSSGMTETPRIVVVVTLVVVVVVQTPAGQASQTLGNEVTYECPPLEGRARQARALRLIAHVVVPLGVVLQHVTRPGLPHIERCAQVMTAALHRGDRTPETTASRATRRTHDM
jgi:hypothetical protein